VGTRLGVSERLSGSTTLETRVSGEHYRGKSPLFKPFAQQRLSGSGASEMPSCEFEVRLRNIISK